MLVQMRTEKKNESNDAVVSENEDTTGLLHLRVWQKSVLIN